MKPMHSQEHQDKGIELSTVIEGKTAAMYSRPSIMGLVEFDVDVKKLDCEHNTTYTFLAPFARLVRSMRRCDRRHLPLLKDWVSVDVAMTQFELVVRDFPLLSLTFLQHEIPFYPS